MNAEKKLHVWVMLRETLKRMNATISADPSMFRDSFILDSLVEEMGERIRKEIWMFKDKRNDNDETLSLYCMAKRSRSRSFFV